MLGIKTFKKITACRSWCKWQAKRKIWPLDKAAFLLDKAPEQIPKKRCGRVKAGFDEGF